MHTFNLVLFDHERYMEAIPIMRDPCQLTGIIFIMLVAPR